ncbi:MAG: caspase family protein [Syntrophus sp. (in: bacteria)]
MQAMPIRIFLILFILVLIYPSASPAATERRIALVIGNSAYNSGPLKNPVNDATAMASQLQKLGFTVILKKNANLRGMEDALTDFGDRLKRGGVGLFFYAGHGLQVGGANYLVPIGAKINRESDIRYETLDAGKILDEMANANNGLNIVILDACRDNPYSRSFRNAARGLAIVSNAPVGTFVSYSTSPGNVARDGDGRNSPYTEALLRYMKEPGLTIEQVFKGARAKLGKETGGKQIPWELSSLQGEFYFVPGSAGKSGAAVSSGKGSMEKDEPSVSAAAATDDLDDENRKLEAEQRRLEEERASFVKKTTTLAMAKRPSVSTAGETGRDGRFIAYSNGTVTDTRTNLMWAAKDNGSDINWANAKRYCENYRGGGYTDWRMPTQDELAGLYDAGKSRAMACSTSYQIHVATELIDITCWVPWASETRGSDAAYSSFRNGKRYWYPQSYDGSHRALPVRSGK